MQFLVLFFLLGTCCTCSSEYAQYADGESESPVHELPRADQCSVITIHIRELSSTLNEVVNEISLLETPVESVSGNREYYDQQLEEYEQRMKLFQEHASSLRKQIDAKEQELQSCLQSSSNFHK